MKRRFAIGCALLILACAAMATAQTPEFEVASLKPSPPPAGDLIYINIGHVLHGELTMTNVSLSDCLRFAYGITNDAQIAGPVWIKDKSVRFDIIARAPAGTPDDQFPLMLQTLLKQRFRMSLHHEAKKLPWLALTIAKGGSKLQEAREGSDSSGNQNRGDRIISNHMSMPLLATLLSRILHQTILDKTGLKGLYEVHLTWTPENLQAAAPETENTPAGPSIFAAVQSQLGLKLEARKDPLDVIVIDSADRTPLPN